MEAPLLVKAEEEEKNIRWEKLKKVASMAAPMVAVNLSQYLLQATSTMIVGHQSEVSLAGIALASSFANVTGFSLLFGLSGALETLCGQAFGAKQHQKLGSYTFTSIVSLLIVCFPVSLLWIFIKKILLSFHQDPQVSEIASVYCLWLIPALFGYSVLQSLVRYLQSQRLIFPMVLSSLTALCIHIPVCWVLVYSLGFGAKGAAISISLSHCLNAVSLWVFAKRSRACEETRIQISKEAFGHMKAFFKLAVPSALMICLEWSAFEILILLSGLLPNAKLETSVISMIFTTSSLHYNLASAVGAAARNYTGFQNVQYQCSKRARGWKSRGCFRVCVSRDYNRSLRVEYRQHCTLLLTRCLGLCLQRCGGSDSLCRGDYSHSLRFDSHGQRFSRSNGYHKRSRKARDWSLREHRGILSGGDSGGHSLVFRPSLERERTLDRHLLRLYAADCNPPSGYSIHQLVRRGDEGERESLKAKPPRNDQSAAQKVAT
ncbi:PREDICTED: protein DETOXIFICATION 9-like isoform X1 [Tarenaya hassleriana]|uniref:protein DETOXIFICATION 9-like isoform X1 n=1 Tax=Tarenaya hassleriana TaxID=28532 RepID=UPI00053C5053|nr:PREDICTED: protein DETOXIFICATION 9-like isoform X1 [Tarenaya hassleriana]